MYQAPNYGGYTRRRSQVEDRYARENTAQAYGRFLGQQRYGRQSADRERGFKRGYEGVTASHARRGTAGPGMSSGVHQRSMRNYVGDYGREQQRAYEDFTQGMQQYDLDQMNRDQWRQNELASIETDRANEIAWAAQNLEMLKSMFGG